MAYVLYQKDFFEAWRIVPYLSVASVFEILSLFVGTIFTAAKKTKMIFATTTIGAISNVLLNLILIPKFGGFGAATATATSFFIVYEVRFAFSKRILRLDANIVKQHIMLAMMVLLSTLSSIGSYLMYIVAIALFVLLRKTLWEILTFVLNRMKRIVRKMIS